MRSILFVCTANICRSPTAEGILRRLLSRQTRLGDFEIESAGTHEYHVGKPPFPAAVEAAKRRGYNITLCIARRIEPHDFDRFDMILAMDRAVLTHLQAIAPTRSKGKIELLTEYSDRFHSQDVADPYGRGERDFELALEMIEDSCRGLAELVTKVRYVR